MIAESLQRNAFYKSFTEPIIVTRPHSKIPLKYKNDTRNRYLKFNMLWKRFRSHLIWNGHRATRFKTISEVDEITDTRKNTVDRLRVTFFVTIYFCSFWPRYDFNRLDGALVLAKQNEKY